VPGDGLGRRADHYGRLQRRDAQPATQPTVGRELDPYVHRDHPVHLDQVDHLFQQAHQQFLVPAGPSMNATDRLATTPAVSANTATSPRTASARQAALVGAHASTTTSAVCGNSRYPTAGRPLMSRLPTPGVTCRTGWS
jgi:hypothetical protein